MAGPLAGQEVRLEEHARVPKADAEVVEATARAFLADELPGLGMDFAPWRFSELELYGLLLGLFLRFELVSDTQTLTDLFNHVHAVAARYKTSGYHCFRHACDIAYLVFFTLYDLGAAEWFGLSKLEIAAVLVSALGHDVLHPGTNNLFQVHAQTAAATLFGAQSPLERQSFCTALRLLLPLGLVGRLNLEHDWAGDKADAGAPVPSFVEYMSRLPAFKGSLAEEATVPLLEQFARVPLDDGCPETADELCGRIRALSRSELLFYRIMYETILNTDMCFHFLLLEELARLVDVLTVAEYDGAAGTACGCDDDACVVAPLVQSPAGDERPGEIGVRNVTKREKTQSLPPPPLPAARVPPLLPSSSSLSATSTASGTRRRPLSVSSPISPLARNGLEQAERAASLCRIDGGLAALQLRTSAQLLSDDATAAGPTPPSPRTPTGAPSLVMRPLSTLMSAMSASSTSLGSSASTLSLAPGVASRTTVSCRGSAPPAPGGDPPPPTLNLPPLHRRLLLSILLHLADISNAARPPEIMLTWSQLVAGEFVAQSDLERTMGLPLTPSMAREAFSQARSSVDFNQLVVRPPFELLSDILPPAGVFVQWCEHNRVLWQIELEASATAPEASSVAVKTPEVSAAESPAVAPAPGRRISLPDDLAAAATAAAAAAAAAAAGGSGALSAQTSPGGPAEASIASLESEDESAFAPLSTPVRANTTQSPAGAQASPSMRLKPFFDGRMLGRERRLSVAAGTVEIPVFMLHSPVGAAAAAAPPVIETNSDADPLALPPPAAPLPQALPPLAATAPASVDASLAATPRSPNGQTAALALVQPLSDRRPRGPASASAADDDGPDRTHDFPFLFHYQQMHEQLGGHAAHPRRVARGSAAAPGPAAAGPAPGSTGNSSPAGPSSAAVVGRWGKLFHAQAVTADSPASASPGEKPAENGRSRKS